MTALALIPARGGSKRIPRKNVLPFCGRPILSYSIAAAQSVGLFDEIMVSTDDEEISSVAQSCGATVPFLRSSATADDHSGLLAVVHEVLDTYQRVQNRTFDLVCCILPTAPLIRGKDLVEGHRLLVEKKFATVVPVVRYGYPIQRSLQLEAGKLSMRWPEYYQTRSQDLPAAFHDAGQFYWIYWSLNPGLTTVFTSQSGALELDELRVQDIDTLQDWKLAEMKYRLLEDIES